MNTIISRLRELHVPRTFLFCCLLAAPLSALADEVTVADANGNELTYSYSEADGPATFKAVKTYAADEAKAGRIVIPASVKDADGKSHAVTAIGASLGNRSKMVTVSIPASVTTIGNNAFQSISTLTTITFATGSQLTTLGNGAFRDNGALESFNLEACTQLTNFPDYVLYNCPSLKALTIPASVTTFGNWYKLGYTNNIETITFLAQTVPAEFYQNRGNLVTLNLGAGVKSIESGAFSGSTGMKQLNINAEVSDLEIKSSAFTNCDALETVSLPKGVITIGNNAFQSCDSLRTFTFATGSQLTTLGNGTFQDNVSLESINLEACTQLTNFPNYVMYNCPSLKSLTIPASVTTFGNWSKLYYTNNIETITFLPSTVPAEFYQNRGKLITLNLGAGVKSIESGAFSGSTGMKHLNINAEVSDLEIKNSAFANCDALETVNLPKGVITIGNNAFQSCDSLRTFTFAKGSQLTTLGNGTFLDDVSLESINLEACTQLTNFPNNVLRNCPSLKALTIPASVTSFGDWSKLYYTNNIETITFLAPTVPDDFYKERGKLTTVNLGADVKSVGKWAFCSNPSLKVVNFDAAASNMELKEGAFYNCDGMKEFTLPACVTTLGNKMWDNCDSLATFTFADGSPLTAIPYNTFAGCYSLEKITIPDPVQTVGQGAFYGCTSLEEITFGTGLTTIVNDWGIFYRTPLKKMVLPGSVVPFNYAYDLPDVILYVPADMVEAYRTNNYTKGLHIMSIGAPTDFAVTTTAGGQLQAQVEAIGSANNVQTLTVTGPINGTDIDFIHSSMPNLEVLNLTNASIVAGGDSYHQWDVNSAGIATIYQWSGPWNTEDNVVGNVMFYNIPTLRSISLPKNATKIGEWAVAQGAKQNLKLTHIDIPTDVTEIGRNAFEWTGIEEVTVPAAVTRLEQYTFANCRNLKKAVLPNGITFIGHSCFSECHAMEDVNIPTAIETIDQYAFYNNKVRTSPVVFPASLKSIGRYAFTNNYRLKSVTFNEGLETIGSWAFSDCNDIESITLPESITKIEDRAFQSLDSITEFTFPANIKVVEDAMLYHCDKLQKVTLAAGTTSIGSNVFEYCAQLTTVNLAEQTSLTYVGRHAFASTGFTTVTLPNSITEMGYSAFRECQNLTSINVPTGLTTVPYDFVCYCPVLTNVQMHDGIRVVGHNAFLGCTSLPTINLNDNITSIEYDAFHDCTSLALDSLPSALTYIGSAAFRNTPAITAALTIPQGVTEIAGNAFNGCGLSAVVLPDGLTKLNGDYIFANTPNLANVKLPAALTRIPNYIFQSATALKRIDIPATVTEIGYAAFDRSGLTVIDLPETVTKIENYAFSNTQLQFFRVPDGITTGPGAYFLENCKRLKKVYMGRHEDYTTYQDFTCCNGCDSLELMRLYFGTPPKCNTGYMGYRTKCVLEVPEDQVAAYSEANGWKDFKEIRGFFVGDVLDDNDYAVLCKLYRDLDGQNWKAENKWDLSNNHHSTGKWVGVTTKNIGGETYAVTAIDLHEQNLKGLLPDSLFQLSHLESANLSGNQLTGDLASFKVAEGSAITELNLSGNQFTGDLYTFASKFNDLKTLDLSFNQLTDISQAIPKAKLTNLNYNYQFIDRTTRQVADNASERYSVCVADSTVEGITEVTVGQPFELTLPRIITYRHAQQDFGFTSRDLGRLYYDGYWRQNWEFYLTDNQWNLYEGNDNVLRAPKGEVLAYTPYNSSNKTLLMRLNWQDGDVNADQDVDALDLQSVIHYALNDRKPAGQMFNFSTADTNSDRLLDVRDIVGTVDYVLGYEAPEGNTTAPARRTNEALSGAALLTSTGSAITLSATEAVAAMQITLSGVSSRQVNINEELQSRFSVAMRDVPGGVRIVIYSPAGTTLPVGDHELLTVDATLGGVAAYTVRDVRLSDAQARRIGVTVIDDTTTPIPFVATESQQAGQVFDLQGRPVGPWHTLPAGIYVITVNGKPHKVRK